MTGEISNLKSTNRATKYSGGGELRLESVFLIVWYGKDIAEATAAGNDAGAGCCGL